MTRTLRKSAIKRGLMLARQLGIITAADAELWVILLGLADA